MAEDSTPEKAAERPSEERTDAPAKRSWRRRLALPVLVIGIAGLVAYWSRTKPVEVEVIYDLGKNAARASRLSVTFYRSGGGEAGPPVSWRFPAGGTTQRRHRHKLTLRPGTYEVRARLSLRALGDRPAEVRKMRRKVEISRGQDQRITLRFR